MARGDGRLFSTGRCGGATFCIDGVEKRESLGTRDEAEALIPMPSMARKNIPARVRCTSSVLYSSADPQLRNETPRDASSRRF